jgi:hypothetical protein
MKFECGDLEKALAHPDSLMAEAREHAKTCPQCRRELRVWNEISSSARELHQDWETPDLWPRIQRALETQEKPTTPWWKDWRFGLAAAAAIVIAVLAPLLIHRYQRPEKPAVAQQHPAENKDFLTEQALLDVEKNEAAYRKSIDQLAHLAQAKLEDSSSPKMVNAQEKILMLDAAIADTRNNVATNRFNLRLQTTLSDLYREKQETLKELLTNDQNN